MERGQDHSQQLRPDSKGRICLGKLAQGVSSFHATHLSDGRIILEPFTEIPMRERWLFDNPVALHALQAGLHQAKIGQVDSLGSFAHYCDEDCS